MIIGSASSWVGVDGAEWVEVNAEATKELLHLSLGANDGDDSLDLSNLIIMRM